ncbi:MAG TPA: hypothetical protein DEB09_01335 [Candidatus Magasanikbacteria bacterium]|nr:hypothetical protein [Candidatus Magasanikbacteria bacterium]
MILKILLAGDGGQGIQLISDLLTQASFANGFFVSQIPNYGLEQRGGVSLSFLIISDKEISYPKFTKPDILLVMSEQARKRMDRYQNADIRMQIDDYFEKLEDQKIEKSSYNIFFLGLIAKLLEEKNILQTEQVYGLLEKKLSKKPNWEGNKNAFKLGIAD